MGGWGGRSGAERASPAGAAWARRTHCRRRRPGLHCLGRGAQAHPTAFSCTARRSRSLRLSRGWRPAGSCARRGPSRGGRSGGQRFKMEMRAGAGRAGGGRRAETAGRAPSGACGSRERGGGGERGEGKAQELGWILAARTGSTGRSKPIPFTAGSSEAFASGALRNSNDLLKKHFQG